MNANEQYAAAVESCVSIARVRDHAWGCHQVDERLHVFMYEVFSMLAALMYKQANNCD